MKKNELFREIKSKTKHLPKQERREMLAYYNEMISERMEDGMTEEDAVAALGTVEELVSSSAFEKSVSLARRASLRPMHIVLIIIGSPLWICLLAVLACLVLVFYVLVWALVLVCYAAFAAFAVASLACIAAGFVNLFLANPHYFFAYFGAGLLLVGFTLLLLLLANLYARAAVRLSVGLARKIGDTFLKKDRRKI